jgi:hypothetical protein
MDLEFRIAVKPQSTEFNLTFTYAIGCDSRRQCLSLKYRVISEHICLPFYLCCNMSITRPPLWSSGQSSWLQIRRLGFDSR